MNGSRQGDVADEEEDRGCHIQGAKDLTAQGHRGDDELQVQWEEPPVVCWGLVLGTPGQAAEDWADLEGSRDSSPHGPDCMNGPSRGTDFLSSASSGGELDEHVQTGLPLTGWLLHEPRGERSGHHGNY